MIKPNEKARWSWPHIVLAGFAVCCLLANVWPALPALTAQVGPTLFGLPFTLVWISAWVLASTAMLA